MMLRARNALTGAYPGPIPGSTEDAGSVQAGDYSFPVVQADDLSELDRIMRPLCDPLKEIVAAANRFFTHKHISEEYATLIIARLQRDGEMKYVNCGHVPPLLVCNHEVIRLPHGNLPVGLLADATYESDHVSLHAGDRLILVTHGVTDAENAVAISSETHAWKPLLPRV